MVGECQGPTLRTSGFLLWLAIAVSCAPVYLMTWRVALRFGARGLVLFALAAAPIGPPHDYQIVVIFPRWVTFSPGIVPVLGVATFFAVLVIVGHIVKGVVFRHARADSFCAVVPGRRREQRATRMYGPTRRCNRKMRMTVWPAQMYPALSWSAPPLPIPGR